MITGLSANQSLFNRAWSVQLTPIVANGKDQYGNVLYQPASSGQLFQQDEYGNNLKVVFDFVKTSEGQSNKGKVEVWNLNPISRKSFQKGAQITLKAGYQGLLKSILTADVLATGVSVERKNSDIVTTFEIGSSERQIELSIISKNYPPGIDFATIVNDCAQVLGVSLSSILGIENFTYNTSVTLSGTVKDALNMLCSGNSGSATALSFLPPAGRRLSWNVVDDELIIKPKGLPTQAQAIVLASGLDELSLPTQNTGLIGVPSRPENGMTKFSALLNPDLAPGQLVQIISQNVNGFFQIQTAAFKGDSHSMRDWQIDCEAYEVPGVTQQNADTVLKAAFNSVGSA